MKVAKLKDEWFVGHQIGAGGFGRVFEAKNSAGTEAGVKLVPKSPGAARELLFVNLEGARRIVPIAALHGGSRHRGREGALERDGRISACLAAGAARSGYVHRQMGELAG